MITQATLHEARPDLTIVHISAERMTTGKEDPVDAVITIQDGLTTLPDMAATNYDYLYSDDPNDNSGYTLAEFYGIITSGRAKTYFNVGDKIKIVVNTNVFVDTEIIMPLYGFNHYRLSGGTEFASCVFGMLGVMNASCQMNTTTQLLFEFRC